VFKKTKLPECCTGCDRILPDIGMCYVYAEPHKLIWARFNQHCPFNPPKEEIKKKVNINPIKRSKRGGK